MKHFMKIKSKFFAVMLLLAASATSWATDVSLSGNETDGYYINMSGTQTLTLSDASINTFKVHNPAGAKYARQLTIIAPEGYTLSLSGKIPETEGDYLYYFCYLKVYDGTTTQTQLGNEKYGCWGYTDPFTLFSTGNSMTLRFIVEGNGKNTDQKGFQNLTVQLLDALANTEYNINISDASGGTCTSNHSSAKKGELVTITTTPGIDYLSDGINVISASGEVISVTSARDNDYYDTYAMKHTFKMPAEEVRVVPSFVRTYSVTFPDHTIMLSNSTAPGKNNKYITGTKFTFKVKYPYTISNVSDGTNTLTAAEGVYTATINNDDLVITADGGRISNVNLNTLKNDLESYQNYLDPQCVRWENAWEREYEALIFQDGDIITDMAPNERFKIADGATITLNNATFETDLNICCKGSATIILTGTNSINSSNEYCKALQIDGEESTLVIKGEGSLTVTGGIGAAASSSIYVCYGVDRVEAAFNEDVIYMFGETNVTGDDIAKYFNITEENGKLIIASKGKKITATKADPYNAGTYYTTFYHSSQSYVADCEVYYVTARADGRLTLVKADGNIIKAGEGVILKSSTASIQLTEAVVSADYDSLLTGSDSDTTVENALVLSLGANGVRFYKYSGAVGAHKAYIAQ